jgi:hypothetical protein
MQNSEFNLRLDNTSIRRSWALRRQLLSASTEEYLTDAVPGAVVRAA